MAETQDLQEIIDAVAQMSSEDRAALAHAFYKLEASGQAPSRDRSREYVWESAELDPNGEDLFVLVQELMWQAVEDLAARPYLLPKDDTDSPVGRMHTATARLSIVLVPFLAERGEELRKLRPAWITEIYHEALAYAKGRSADWMPSEHEMNAYVMHKHPVPSAAVGA